MERRNTTPDQFACWLRNHLKTSTDESTVDLIPAPCGIGKSYSMTVQIGEALQNYNAGLILVTDEIERMRGYTSAQDSLLNEYLQRNMHRILIYEAANAKSERNNLYRKQILVMSTQRYFALSRKEVLTLVNSHIPRRHIFIDERAPLSETIRVDLSTFNDVDTIINLQLDNTAREKEWLIQQWRNLRTRYDNFMSKYEASHDDYELHLWHSDSDSHATTDDERFLHLATETYASKLKRADNNILKKIRAVFKMVNDGALFISRRKPDSKAQAEYSNFFLVVIDHSDLLLNVGSKSVILDGTGDIDPVYNTWFINRVNCDQFKRDLSNLTVNIVDVNTSRNAIAKNPASNTKLAAIVDYVKTLPKTDAVFTYGKNNTERDTVEQVFGNAGFQTGHFGGLKGKNQFRHMTDIVQVGLNRIPDEFYMVMAIQNISQRHKPNRQYYGIINLDHAAHRIMLLSVLCDLEQNLFRGTIRNADNQQRQTFTLLYKCKPHIDQNGVEHNELAELTTMIRERYEPLGATVNVHDTPSIVLRQKTRERKSKDGKQTPAQKLTDYLDRKEQEPNQLFKLASLLADCDISREQFKNAVRKNGHIKQRLNSIKTKKQGWYMFPAS